MGNKNIPCECGNTDASWRDGKLSGQRIYSCEECWKKEMMMTFEEMKESFKHPPYLKESILIPNYELLKNIEKTIIDELKDYPNFSGIDFTDVGARGIQIRGHHKDIKGYCYGDQITLNYDFTNWEECIKNFIGMWKSVDNEDYLKYQQEFIKAGEKYGWD
jgi:hypothetical protein